MSLQTSSKNQGSDARPGVLESKVLICAFTPRRRIVFTIRVVLDEVHTSCGGAVRTRLESARDGQGPIRRWRHVTKWESSIVVRHERGTAPFRN
jgi:hypothetical protein